MPDYETIEIIVEEGLAHFVLNRPEQGNAFDATFCREFGEAANHLSQRRDVRAVLLRAAGKYFSVGGDLSLFMGNIETAPAVVLDTTFHLHMGLTRLLRMDAPIVAAVHGTVAGGALALLSNCDVIFAARSARLGAAYSHIGFTCDLGASFGLASRMGIARARRFLLLGELLSAEEALAVGLVDHVTDDDQVAEEAQRAAIALSHGPTRAYGEIRRLMARSLGTGFEAQLEDEVGALVRASGTADAREGLTAFLEKRAARFRGE